MGRIVANSRAIDTRLARVIEKSLEDGNSVPKFAATFGDFAGRNYIRNQLHRPASTEIGISQSTLITRAGLQCTSDATTGGRIIIPSVFGFTNSGQDLVVTIGVTVPPGGSAGSWFHIGSGDGIGFGIGDTTMVSVGTNIICHRAGVAWVNTGVALSPGFHVITFLVNDWYDALVIYLDGNTSAVYNAATAYPFNNPTTHTEFGSAGLGAEGTQLHFGVFWVHPTTLSAYAAGQHFRAWEQYGDKQWRDPANLGTRYPAYYSLPSVVSTTSFPPFRASRAQQHLMVR